MPATNLSSSGCWTGELALAATGPGDEDVYKRQVSDLLQIVWERARSGNKDSAYELFQCVLPQIVYSLQSLEFFHHVEKALLVARGVLADSTVRDATLTVDAKDQAHINFLNQKILDLLRRQEIGIPTAISTFVAPA